MGQVFLDAMKYADADFPLLASGWRYSSTSSTSLAVLCSLALQLSFFFFLDFLMLLPLVPATKVVDFADNSYFGLT